VVYSIELWVVYDIALFVVDDIIYSKFEWDIHLLIWLVETTYPSEKYDESSVGVMKFPTEWNNKIHVPNHQPVIH